MNTAISRGENPFIVIPKIGQLKTSFKFAKAMIQNHRLGFTGGGQDREGFEIFNNAFQGKISEFAVRDFIRSEYPQLNIDGDIDLDIYPRGKWDKYDLLINNKNINIKSIKHFSKYLLIEKARFNDSGNYNYYNNDGLKNKVDYYIIVKVYMANQINREDLKKGFAEFVIGRNIKIEIMGGLTHNDFWERKMFFEKGYCIGKSTPLQVDNYAVKTDDLTSIDYILKGIGGKPL